MTYTSHLSDDELFESFLADAKHSFTGWDFSYIEDTVRMTSEPLPWSYASKVLPIMRVATSMLDMGTGGGELLSFLAPFPKNTVATEMYEKNFPIARSRLEPLGIKVVTYTNKYVLPFKDNTFDLVINKHEFYPPDELYRILKPDGIFITQQVGEKNFVDLVQLLHGQKYREEGLPAWYLNSAVKDLEKYGLDILEQKEAFPITRFYDIGALMYYLVAVPFVINDFIPEKYSDELKKIHQKIIKQGYIDLKSHRFYIKAQKN